HKLQHPLDLLHQIPVLGSVPCWSAGGQPLCRGLALKLLDLCPTTPAPRALGPRGLASGMTDSLAGKIWEHLEKKLPQVRERRRCFKTTGELQVENLANSVDNACKLTMPILLLPTLGSGVRESWPCASLCKVASIGPTQCHPISMLALASPLFTKNHEEVRGLQAQTANSGLTVEVDAHWGSGPQFRSGCDDPHRAKRHHPVLADGSGFQEKSEGQLETSQGGWRPTMPCRWSSTWNQSWPRPGQKGKAEITSLCHLLEIGRTSPLVNISKDVGNAMQTIQKVITYTIVDGKVVSETSDTKVVRH
ncbi:hypothetical protein J0S82_004017, partial [Galemys pyrenaicus]